MSNYECCQVEYKNGDLQWLKINSCDAINMPDVNRVISVSTANSKNDNEDGFNWNRRSPNCRCGSGLVSRILNDARDIFISRICDFCEKRVKAKYRPEIFTDPNYETTEPIDEE